MSIHIFFWAIENKDKYMQNRFMYNSIWYNNLIKPPMAPPNWLFAPVWGILYAMIAAALIIYINKQGYGKKSGYIFFVIQLVLNFIWSPVFFGMQNMTLALVIVILMDIFVFLTFKKFYSVSKISGLLLIPYFLWILFATYLNAGYLFLNI